MTIKLYCFGESGHSYKVALALQVSGLDWEPVYVDFFGGEARSPAFRKNVNEMGECPVLVDGDVTLSQSGVILDYLSDKTRKFQGGTAEESREVLRWILWDNHKMSSVAGITRFLVNFLPEDKRPQEVIAFNQGRLLNAYKILDRHLEGRDWIVGNGISNADFSCCAYFYYPEPFGFDRTAYPNIDLWLSRISAQPGWKLPYDLMPGSPVDRA